MRALINLTLLALLAGAGYVAVTQPDALPLRLPWTQPEATDPAQPAPPATGDPSRTWVTPR